MNVLLRLFAFFVLSFSFGVASAQDSTVRHHGIRISLLTCGVGEEAWETFGHTGVRIIDSSLQGAARDIVYNYGTFDGFDKNFEQKFMQGKLLYYVSVYPFAEFMQEYLQLNRTVFEQVLLLSEEQKEILSRAFQINTEPENRYYKYDFFFDNCATRIRDIIPNNLTGNFEFGQALPVGKSISFRDIINKYFYRKHWTRFGVNILLGSKIDKPMTNKDIMFLPDYLSIGIGNAKLNGTRICTDQQPLIKGAPEPANGPDAPLFVMLGVMILTVIGVFIPKLQIVGRIMTSFLLLVTGLLGVILLVMWFGTDHQACRENFNLLWALPTNLLLVFARPKGRGKYAIIAMLFLLVTLLLHIFRIQCVTILEMLPFFVALLAAYWGVFKRSSVKI
jgi:Domain of unknown function (DUF4105)